MSTLRQEVSQILGVRVEDDSPTVEGWNAAFDGLDKAGMLTAKHRNKLLILLCKHVEELENAQKTHF